MKRSAQVALGGRLAARLPAPRVQDVNGTYVVVGMFKGLSADELLALSEFYLRKYAGPGR